MGGMRKRYFLAVLIGVPLFFLTALAQEETDLRDVKPPVNLAGNVSIYLFWVLIAFLLCAIVIAIFLLRKKKQNQVRFIPPPPAWVIAYEKIEQLKADQLISKGKVKEYFSRLSDIVRHYLEDRFAFKAPEMTTEEFLWKSRDWDLLDSQQKEFLKEFLTCCDMAKFAKYPSSSTEMEQSLVAAKKLIDETREDSQATHEDIRIPDILKKV